MKNDMGLSQRIPHNYAFAGHWQINLKGWALVVLLASAVIVFGLTFILGLTIRGLLRGYFEGSVNLDGWVFLIVLGVFVAVIILHEGVHGLVFLVFGGKPRFGVRNQYLLVILAPFLTLTLVFLAIGILANAEGIAALAIMAMAINTSGSIGDLMTAWKIRRHGRKTLYEDTENGFNWYVPSAESQTHGSS